jgi:apolipoprotein N-acyltransferase
MLLFLPALTGLLLIASFPRASQGYLAWVALVPLIAYIFLVKTRARAFWGGFVAGFIELFFLLIWMPRVLTHYGGLAPALAWVAYGLLVAVLACYTAVPCAVSKHFLQRGGSRFLFLFPAFWILSEYALSYSPFGGFPWLLAGYTQADNSWIIQIADIAGVYGISFLVVWGNTMMAWILVRKWKCAEIGIPLTATILLVAASLSYGAVSLRRWENGPRLENGPRWENRNRDYQVAMLQMNLSFDEPEQVLADKYRRGYLRMADELMQSDVDLIVLPESPSPIFFQYDPAFRQTIRNLARQFPLGIIFNNISTDDSGEENHYFNSAYYLDGDGVLKGVYSKIHLVPFGEYIPLKSLFSFVESISKDVGEFAPGHDVLIIEMDGHPCNAIICFEAIFPGLVRRFPEKGSQLIINLTNDGWYGRSSAPYQHLAIARFRAVENRRYLIRAANSGFSALIEPTGKIQASSGLFQEAVCRGRFAFLAGETFYTRYGDVLIFLCAIISVGSLIYIGFRNGAIRKRHSREETDARRTE